MRNHARARLITALALGALSCGAGGGVSPPPEPVMVQACGSAVCDSAIRYTTEIPIGGASEVSSLTITLCHGAVCASRRPAITLDTDLFDCRVSGLLEATCSLRPIQSGSTTYGLAVAFAGPGQDYQDGDAFRVRVDSPTAPLLDWSGTARKYDSERPNGEGCDPLCRYTTLN